ncbi:hypothetical protein RUND412_001907 [Rhizina undulata]
MPVINGVKFACEPCMRGHRSSKCAHKDRVLVRVRKPGRPLSSCPHTLTTAASGDEDINKKDAKESGTVNCGCEVTVAQLALPKNALCACGPGNNPSAGQAGELMLETTIVFPTPEVEMGLDTQSPTSPLGLAAAANANGRIQKNYHRNRKKSVVEDGKGGQVWGMLKEKEKEEAVNGKLSPGKNPNMDGNTGYGKEYGMFMHGSTATNENRFRRLTLDAPQDDIAAIISSLSPDPMEMWNREAKLTFPTRACKSTPAPALSPRDHPQRHHPRQLPQRAQSSCCAKRIKPVPYSQVYQTYLPPHFPQQQQNQAYTHPAGVQTINHPVTPEELAWLQQQRAAGVFGDQGRARVLSTSATPSDAVPPLTSNLLAGNVHTLGINTLNSASKLREGRNGSATSWEHRCNCGPSCNCLGCAVHPFNRRTIEYAREMGELVVSQSPHAATPAPLHSVNSTPPNEQRGCCGGGNHGLFDENSTGQDEDEDEKERDRGDGARDNSMSPSAFLYVDYPMVGCDTGRCSCGEGCTCEGCLTHGMVNSEHEVGAMSQSGLSGSGMNMENQGMESILDNELRGDMADNVNVTNGIEGMWPLMETGLPVAVTAAGDMAYWSEGIMNL